MRKDRADESDLRWSRKMALTAASSIAPDPADDDGVLAAMSIIEAFLLGGDISDSADLAARRDAVRQHMHNLLIAGLSRGVSAGEFVTAAWKYYDRIIAPAGPGPERGAGR